MRVLLENIFVDLLILCSFGFLNKESKNNSCLNSPIDEKNASLNCMSQDDSKSANCNGPELDCVSMTKSFLNEESKNNSCLNSPIGEKDASLNCMSQDDSKSANCNGSELDCVSMNEKNMEHLSAVERNLNCNIPRVKLQTIDLCKYEARSQRRCRIIKSEIFKSKKIKRARIKHSHIQEELKTVYKKSNLL
ncbi:uncharacterized protein LOC112468966, partial [Temnothorax curvispinosus]|uniref:Uncharacterized protein LOC112468966 n=1 Tax=Temnothorax curvispinosus TaxID=300111 RepID=A0A6J1RNR0_9HYME